MDLNAHLADLNRLEAQGAVVILKWDGERTENKRTVVISKPGTEFTFRMDCDDMEAAIEKGIASFDAHFATGSSVGNR